MKKHFLFYPFFLGLVSLLFCLLVFAADIWTCSMHPQVRESAPGFCPICHMALVKINSSSETKKEAQIIEISGKQASLIGLKMGKVQKKDFFKSIEVAGRVAFDPELFTAQNEYLESLKQRESVKNSPLSEVKHSAQAMVDSSKTRLKVLGLSDSQIQKISQASPESSFASSLLPQKGEKTWIYAEVYEMDLPYVRPQMKALLSSSSFKGRKISGEVISVDRLINTQSRTAKVRILLNSQDVEKMGIDLRPESFVEVTILSSLGKQLVVDREAILDTGKQAYAFVKKDKVQGLEKRSVILGPSGGENNDEVAILEGLSEGEDIVTSANFLIDSESRLRGSANP